MNILFVTDYVCPYCIVAKTALKKAISELDLDATITTHPFELTPLTKDRVDTYSDPVRREHYKVLDEPMKKLGLALHIPPKVIPRPYTHLAFQGFLYTMKYNLEEQYSDLVYQAYFQDELDIGELSVLSDIILKLGLDVSDFEKSMNSNEYSLNVDLQVQYARERLNVQHVPTIFIDDVEVNVEDYSVEAFKEVLLHHDEPVSEGITGCDEDGCGEESNEFGCGEDGCSF